MADDRFYGLVTCELAATHFGDEFVGEPVHPVATECQRGLCDRGSLPRGDGCWVDHRRIMSEHGRGSMSRTFGYSSPYRTCNVKVWVWQVPARQSRGPPEIIDPSCFV
jgi:hypothetical protein